MSQLLQKRPFRIACTLVLIAGALAAILALWVYHTRYPSTNDLFVEADLLAIAARVSGPVIAVHVTDNQHVNAGDPLFEIDPTDFKKALDSAEANLAMAKVQFDMTSREIAAAQDVVSSKLATLENERINFNRAQDLLNKGAGTREAFDNANARMLTAEADLKKANEELERIKIERGTAETNPRILAAQTARDEAALQLGYTKIAAPVSGHITNLNLPVGTYVNEGERRITLIADGTWRVAANYKETDLRFIEPGMKAEIRLKMYPGEPLMGVVQGIAWAIAQEDLTNSALPVIDPTIDWVRLARRFPVRISLDDPQPGRPLRIGATGYVRVIRESR